MIAPWEGAIKKALDFGSTIANKFKTKAEREAAIQEYAEREEARLHEEILAQLEINKIEASQKGFFVKWRPGGCWMFLFILGWDFIGIDNINWLVDTASIWVADLKEIPDLPRMPVQKLNAILLFLTTCYGVRSFDKIKGVNSGK